MTENTATANAVKAPAATSGERAGNAKKLDGLMVGVIVGVVVAVIGIVAWMMQLSGGMVQTGMRNFDSWGLYITCFMFFVGLSAGGLIISSIPNALGVEGFGGISKVAIWTAVCSTVAAVGFIIVDLGGPARLWHLFAFANLTSPLMWDVIVISTYFVLSIVYLWAYLRYEAGKMSHTAIRVISVCALAVAIGVHTVTAWIFALAPAHEFWHTALMGPWFVASALVCGTALVLAVVIGLRRAGYLDLEQRHVERMSKMLGAFICVDLYFYACDLLTSGYFGGSGAEVVTMLTSGPLAPFFWFQIVASAACAIVCFTPSLRRNGLLVCGAVLAILAIFSKRVQILVGGFQLPNIELPGVITQYTVTNWQGTFEQAYDGMVYWPTGIEWAVALGVVGLAVACLFAGLKWLPLKPVDVDG